MKKYFLILISAVLFIFSCSENSTEPDGKKELLTAKTNSNLMIPLAVGNKWIYSKSDGSLRTNEITSMDSMVINDFRSIKIIPTNKYIVYSGIWHEIGAPLGFGIYDNLVFNTYATDEPHDIYDENKGVLINNKWHSWFKTITVEFANFKVTNAKLAIYDETPDEMNIQNGILIKKGIGIITYWIDGKKYELKEVVLN